MPHEGDFLDLGAQPALEDSMVSAMLLPLLAKLLEVPAAKPEAADKKNSKNIAVLERMCG